MEKEIWKSVNGYEGLYEVSSYGRVRSLGCIIIDTKGRTYLHKGRILKPVKDKDGYYYLPLSKKGKRISPRVHRLVAEAFIPNPNNLPQVNHKDENKTNNRLFLKKDGSVDLDKSNLEWCDSKYNINYGTAIQRRAVKRSMPVLQLDKDTDEVIAEYPSAKEAARQLNIFQGGISNCCNEKCKTYKGFKWQYADKNAPIFTDRG